MDGCGGGWCRLLLLLWWCWWCWWCVGDGFTNAIEWKRAGVQVGGWMGWHEIVVPFQAFHGSSSTIDSIVVFLRRLLSTVTILVPCHLLVIDATVVVFVGGIQNFPFPRAVSTIILLLRGRKKVVPRVVQPRLHLSLPSIPLLSFHRVLPQPHHHHFVWRPIIARDDGSEPTYPTQEHQHRSKQLLRTTKRMVPMTMTMSNREHRSSSSHRQTTRGEHRYPCCPHRVICTDRTVELLLHPSCCCCNRRMRRMLCMRGLGDCRGGL